jgi:hypothetical protein
VRPFSSTAFIIVEQLAGDIALQAADALHESVMDWSHLDEPDLSGADP